MKSIAGATGSRGATSLLAACLVPFTCVLLTGCPGPQASAGPAWIANVPESSTYARRTVAQIQSAPTDGLVAEVKVATGSVIDSTEPEGAAVVDND